MAVLSTRPLAMLSLLLCCLLLDIGHALTVRAPSYPLAVRNPYLQAWLHGNSADDLPTARAMFWTNLALTWEAIARVNGQSYYLFGYPKGLNSTSKAKQQSISMTSTHTLVTLQAGEATILMDFFTPVSPANYTRQAMPYSYLTISATTTNGASVQIFNAIDDSWAAPNYQTAVANYSTTGMTGMYMIHDPAAAIFSSVAQMASWGNVVFASRPNSGSAMTQMCGSTDSVRQAFLTGGGKLSGQQSTCNTGDLLAIAHDLGTVTGTKSVTFAVGQDRFQVVDYHGETRVGYQYGTYSTPQDSVSGFFDDYTAANTESGSIDQQIRQKGEAISSNYADILELSVRQVFGCMEITVDSQSKNTSDPLVFLKEISSDGNVNTIGLLYLTYPMLYFMDPSWIRLLLEPVLRYLQGPSPKWTLDYMIHDIGNHYPNATGHDNNQVEVFLGYRKEFMPIEPTAAALTLVAAYHKATGDDAWVKQYQPILTTNANFLMGNYMANVPQLSFVDALPFTSNQTQLVVASAVALNAFGTLYNLDSYKQKAQSIVASLYTNGLGLDSQRTHFTAVYAANHTEDDTWSIMFPFFGDALLGLQTFPQAAYDMQSTWYGQQMTSYGLPYINDQDFGITDYNLWMAALATGDIRNNLIDTTHNFLTNPTNNRPFQTKYNVAGAKAGKATANIARSSVSSNFALLILQGGASQIRESNSTSGTTTNPTTTGSGPTTSTSKGAAVELRPLEGRSVIALLFAAVLAAYF